MADTTEILTGGSTSGGTVLQTRSHVLPGGSTSTGAVTFEYAIVVAGTSNTGGTVDYTYGKSTQVISGGSTSGGSVAFGRTHLLNGGATSGGTLDYTYLRVYPYELVGGSTSGGVTLLDRALLLTGGSTSGGSLAFGRSHLLAGGSTSGGTVYFEQIDVLVAYACYVLSETGRTHQYSFEDFRGFDRFNNRFMGIKADGLYDLESTATTDNGTAISASMEWKTDFSMPEYKRLMNLMIAGEGASYKVTITDYEGNVNTYTLTPDEFRHLSRSTKTKAITIKVENVAGEAITIRQLKGKLALFKH